MRDFKELEIWKKSHGLTLSVYKMTEKFPREEKFGLVSQMRRSCSSIPTNIAEGCGRAGDAEFMRFLTIAMGSACEIEYQLLLARDLGFCGSEEYTNLSRDLIAIKKMMAAFLVKIRARNGRISRKLASAT